MKPIAWRHMIFWGAISGAMAGAIYLLILLTYYTWGFVAVLAGAQIGMTFGALLGLISGFIIETLLPIETRKFNANYRNYQIITVAAVSLICAIVSYPLTPFTLETLFPLDTIYWWTRDPYLLAIPSIFATIGSGYATWHYLKRLRQYTLPPRKSKDTVEKIKRLEIPQRQTIDDYLYSQASQQRRNKHE